MIFVPPVDLGHVTLDDLKDMLGIDINDVVGGAMSPVGNVDDGNLDGVGLPDLDNLSGIVNSGSIADIDWANNLEGLYDKMDQWIQAEMSYNDESMDRSMLFNAEQAEMERAYNSAEAAKNRDWQEYMSNTSYQRAVEDMRKAGLNPMLLSARASGATTPSGAMATATSARSAGNASISGLSDYLPKMLSAIGSMVSSTGSLLDVFNLFPKKTISIVSKK